MCPRGSNACTVLVVICFNRCLWQRHAAYSIYTYTKRPASGHTTSVLTMARRRARYDNCREGFDPFCKAQHPPSWTMHTPKVPRSRIRVPAHPSQPPRLLTLCSSLMLQGFDLRPHCMLPLATAHTLFSAFECILLKMEYPCTKLEYKACELMLTPSPS